MKWQRRWKNKTSRKIDILFPFVDCNDPEWQKLYYENLKKYKKVDTTWDDWATGMKRFRPNGTLKYVFRGIEKNCPWVNNVYMIVQSESQIPKWINRDTVKIIYHKDFIPEEYLPTFNSSTIEMFLHNIKPLSEYFVYGNDDTVFTSKVKTTDFFRLNKLVFGIKTKKFNPSHTGDILRKSDYLLFDSKFRGYVYDIQHTYMPHNKSLMREVFSKYKNKILKTITPFRTKDEHNQWIFSIYARKKNRAYNSQLSNMSTEIKASKMSKILRCDWTKYKSVCFNDHKTTTDEQVAKVNEKFKKMFPNKSKYEK